MKIKKIKRDLHIEFQATANDRSYIFFLNGARCFIEFGTSWPRVHVGTEDRVQSLMTDITDPELQLFVLELIKNEHGSMKISMDNPNIKQFLKVTKCI